VSLHYSENTVQEFVYQDGHLFDDGHVLPKHVANKRNSKKIKLHERGKYMYIDARR
jgi:hypothetical protein